MKKFKILVAGQLISSLGSGLTDFGLAIYVLAATGSVTATSIVSICAFLPFILFAPAGGVLADRFDRRTMMMLGELLSGLGLAICLIPIMSETPSLPLICIGVGISSLFKALTEPAFKATVTDLVSEEDYARAGGMVQIASNAKLLISPAIAGVSLQITGVSTLILLDILTFFTTVLMIAIMKKDMETKPRQDTSLNFRKEMMDGTAAIRGKDGIVPLILIMTFTVFSLGFVQILSRPLILAFTGETELGVLATVSAFGMLAGSMALSLIKNVNSYVRMLSRGLIGCGIFFALMGLRENLFFIAMFGFLMFAFMPAIQVGAEVLIRKNLASEVQGRGFGFVGFITQLGYIFAYLLSGVLADYVFEPFMQGQSIFALKLGAFIGTGAGRGIALLILIAGITLSITGIAASRLKSIKSLERRINQNETITETCPEGL